MKRTITIKRTDEEIAADQQWAKKYGMSVHAWRRFMLNIANGIVSPDEMIKKSINSLKKY